MFFVCFFFCFKQKTAYEMRISDWSSDVCSSDLNPVRALRGPIRRTSLSVPADALFGRHSRQSSDRRRMVPVAAARLAARADDELHPLDRRPAGGGGYGQ